MPLFRCLECNREFEALKPACAECGVDPEKDARDVGVVQEIKTHHFDPPSRREGRGMGHAACDPKLKVGHPACMFTGEPSSVNCPKCKASEAFVAAGGLSNGAVAMKTGPLPKTGG